MVGYAEKAQHLRRCSPHNIRYPRVACTIVWQPWAIKSATPTALKCSFYVMIHISSCLYLWRIAPKKYNTYGIEEHNSSYNLRHFMQPSASFHRSICVISSHKTRLITRPFASIHFALYYQQCCHLKLTLQRPPQFQRLTTPLPLRGTIGRCS